MGSLSYVRPQTLEAALDHLDRHGSATQILAGGTDLVLDLRSGGVRPAFILDVSRLPELKGISLIEEGLSVGAGVTLAEIEASKLLQREAPALWKCAFTFASRQIRNAATIGGNVAHCSPCGDTVPPLVIHEACAVLAAKKGIRSVPVEQIASGPYACALPPDEIILRFILKPADGITFCDFQKIGRRKELAIARLNAAAMARQEPDGRIAFLRFSLGSCTPTPQRLPEVEDHLVGRTPTPERIWEAGRILAERTIALTGRRPSTAYKESAIQGLFFRMLHPLARS
jgi:CO/xanthine dehydrogenase FAD-binding subunit